MSWSWSNQPVLWDFYIIFLLVASLWMFVTVFCPKRGVTDTIKTDKNLAWLGVTIVTSLSRGKEMSGHFYTYGWFFFDFVKFTENIELPAIYCFENLDRQSSWKNFQMSQNVHKHDFLLWAQRKPNTRLEICKAFQDRLTVSKWTYDRLD